MRINGLSIENYRGFVRADWEFAPGFNVFIGDNGVGKTAVLDAIAIALDPLIWKAEGTTARAIRPDDVRIDRDEPQFPVVIEASGTYLDEALVWRRTLSDKPNAKTTNKDTRDIRRRAERLFADVRGGSSEVIAPVVSYFTTGRLWRQKREKLEDTVSPASRLSAYDFSLDAAANDSYLFRWFKTQQLAALQSVFETGRMHDPSLEAIRQAISHCLEGRRRYISFDIRRNEVIAADEGGQDRIPFRMMSDGQRTIAAMILDLGYRCAVLNPHLGLDALTQTPGVVLIDEIDLHLHPRWQRRIVGDLRTIFPNIQFFATTHSSLIIQSLEAGELIDLGPQVDDEPEKYVGKSPEDILENVMNVEMPQRSKASVRRYEAAMEYYRLLRDAQHAPRERIDQIKERLDQLMVPYFDNEAYAAYVSFLREERIASGIDSR